MEFPRQEYWSGLPFPGDLPDPGIKPAAPALAGAFSATESPGNPDFSLCYIGILTCFGVFHLNLNKQASNLLIAHPASDISSVQAPVHSGACWEMLSSYLLHFRVSCGLSAPPSRLSPPSSIKAALLRSSVTSTCKIWCQFSSPLPASHPSIFENRCTFSLENFLYWFPVVSHFMGSSFSVFFAESFPYAWHPSVCYKHGFLWALFSQYTYSLFHGNQHHDVKCHLEADDNQGISLQPHSLPHRPELTLLADWRLHLDALPTPQALSGTWFFISVIPFILQVSHS